MPIQPKTGNISPNLGRSALLKASIFQGGGQTVPASAHPTPGGGCRPGGRTLRAAGRVRGPRDGHDAGGAVSDRFNDGWCTRFHIDCMKRTRTRGLDLGYIEADFCK